MRTLFIIPLVLMSLVSLPSWSGDYKKGIAAGKRGDFKTAVKEFTALAQEGDAKSQMFLGWHYSEGLGVTKNLKTAVKWYTLSAEQGNFDAQHNLGFMFANGHGVNLNHVRAHMWWNIAGKIGKHSAALRDLQKIEKHMTPSEITKARDFAVDCIAKNFKGC